MTSATTKPVPFQSGVQIDWPRRAVIVDSHVVLRRGPLEFFACLPGKEHESVLRLDAAGVHIYMALGLIGLMPGHAPEWDEARGSYGRPAGDLLDVTCEWEQDGQPHSANAFDWMREVEWSRTPLPRPWVFCGSLRLSDGSLACDRSGAAFAVVDFPESLVALSRGGSSANAALWVEANTAAIPPAGTRVRLVLRPAQARAHRVVVDFRGEAYLDGRYVSYADLADVLLLARQLEPGRVQTLVVEDALRSDVPKLLNVLREFGYPPDALRVTRRAP